LGSWECNIFKKNTAHWNQLTYLVYSLVSNCDLKFIADFLKNIEFPWTLSVNRIRKSWEENDNLFPSVILRDHKTRYLQIPSGMTCSEIS